MIFPKYPPLGDKYEIKMANWLDLGSTKKITERSFYGHENDWFFYDRQNEHIYASEDRGALSEIEGAMQSQIQRIDGIRQLITEMNSRSPDLSSQLIDFSNARFFPSQSTDSSSPLFRLMDQLSGAIPFDETVDDVQAVTVHPTFPSEEEILCALLATTSTTRSDSGTDGVYFLDGEHELTHSIILKVYSESDRPIDEVIADRFFQCFDFITPQYYLVDKKSEIGSLACDKLRVLELSKTFETQQLKKKQQKLRTTIDEPSPMTLMLLIEGKPFAELTYAQKEEILTQNVLQALGEMLLFDAVIGNVDRLKEKDCNPGNFFLLPQNGRRKSIALLDHGYGLRDKVLFEKAKSEIGVLLKKEAKEAEEKLEKIMNTLFQSLWPNIPLKSIMKKNKKKKCLKHLHEGVILAAKSLVNTSINFKWIFEEMPENEREKHIAQFKDLVEFVRLKLN